VSAVAPSRPPASGPLPAPPYPIEGVASWNMNTTCNYRCSYCTQRFVDDRGRWSRDLPRFVDAFLRLPGDWEIKLSGGEPFVHPDLLDAVRALAAGGRRVSVVTNLSASLETLRAFAEATAARPGLVSASLHLEYVEPEAFADKLVALRDAFAGEVMATCVATRDTLPRLPALIAAFAARGLRLVAQPEKQDRDVIAYAPEEHERLIQLGGHAGVGLVAPSYEGRGCWAGARYFIVDDRGEAFRCYPARRRRTERLGNLLDPDFRLRLDPEPCRYTYCNCAVPARRGMVDGGTEFSPVE
jgi:organic radical activating enzyme